MNTPQPNASAGTTVPNWAAQTKVMKQWLQLCSGHPNLLADAADHRAYNAALVKGFKRGVRFGRTGK